MKYSLISLLALAVLVPTSAQAGEFARLPSVNRISVVAENPFQLHIDIAGQAAPQAQMIENPDRLVIDLPNTRPGDGLHGLNVNRGGVRAVRSSLYSTPVVGDNAVSNSSVRFPSIFAGPQVQARNRRPVYPYSVVPGGVGSAEELREVADHDPVVSEHYAGFDYRLARVIEVNQPRLVYLSYRRGGKIFWTRKQASLHVGEKLLTDGHITARTRCGNQVSVLPQANISPQEPTIAELDRPDAMASGMYQAGPSDFDSRLFNLDPGLPLGPASSLPGNLFAGGPPPGAFMPLPIGGVSLNPPTGHACPPNTTQTTQGCSSQSPPPPPPPPPPAVPEPTTILLVATGAATVLAHRWRKGA